MPQDEGGARKYSELVSEVDELMRKMQTCEDVDDALSMYEAALERLTECETRLKRAEGRITEIQNAQGFTAPTAVGK